MVGQQHKSLIPFLVAQSGLPSRSNSKIKFIVSSPAIATVGRRTAHRQTRVANSATLRGGNSRSIQKETAGQRAKRRSKDNNA
jgi:hypothetical protein